MGLFDVSADEKEGKDIIKITVASGSEKPYYKKKYGMSEKGCYIRNGTAADPMPQKMIDELFAKRTRDSIGKIKSSHQDLNFEQLKIYYEGKGITLNKQFTNNLELLTEDGNFNYVAYLMADKNGTSIKVAKYNGIDRVDLIENEDYGYCSLIKSTKSVLDKMDLENKTITQITAIERDDKRIWSVIALKEAVLNAFVHNDYTTEVPPKFEIFDDRIEITSTGGLPNSLSQDEFFEGFSVPRNKELMRIYKDIGLVEQLGSGVPRILKSYGKECFKFSDNFLRMTFPKQIESNEMGEAEMGVAEMGATIDDLKEIQISFGSITNRILLEKEENVEFLKSVDGVFSDYVRTNFGLISDELRTNFGEKTFYTLMLISIDPTITAKNIGEVIGVSSRSIETYLSKLRNKNIIQRIGSDKAGTWKIINTN
jgi:predicted HTH transcriptional regulator